MYLKQLDVYQIRNLKHVQLSFCPGANFLFGANGSGKTSLLEAIYLLGRGRSFRSRNIRTVITHDQEDCTVFGRLCHSESYVETPLGVTRGKSGDIKIRMAGEQVRSAASLAEELPLQLINSDSFNLLEGGPLYRRQFLDWGVFHVEHEYRELWQHFQRCLKHRNSLLRRDRIDRSELTTWDAEFARFSEQIGSYRTRYLEQYVPVFESVFAELANEVSGVEFGYQKGWDAKQSLVDVLAAGRERDCHSKTSNYGAHRADLKVKVNTRAASEVLSRGQIKTVVCALQIAQGYLYRQLTGKRCVYLLDDLPSELDREHRQKVGALLQQLDTQVFVTGVFQEDLKVAWPANAQAKMFHVEQGKIASV